MTTPAAAASAGRKFRPAPISSEPGLNVTLVSQYNLNSGSVADSVGGVNGTVTGAWTSTAADSLVSGVSGQSFYKTGGAAYFTIPASNPAHALAALSFSFYYQPTFNASSQCICARGNGSAPGGFSIERRDNGRLRGWHVGQDGGIRNFGGDTDGIPGTNLAVGTAYRITVTMGLGGVKVYLNDTLVSHTPENINTWANGSPWVWGIWTDLDSIPMWGVVDHIRVWDGELQASGVAALEPATSITPPAGEEGIAAGFVQDAGISSHPSVILHDNWEDGNFTGWSFFLISGSSRAITTTPAEVHSGTNALELVIGQRTNNDGGGHMEHFLSTERTTMHVRYYVKFDPAWDLGPRVGAHAGVGIRGCGPTGCTLSGVAGDGVNKFSVSFEPWQTGTGGGTTAIYDPPGRMTFYMYHMDQPGSFGHGVAPNIDPDAAQLSLNTWHCIELMVKVNDVGSANGEVKGWVDGVLVAHLIGMRFRSVADLQISEFRLGYYIHDTVRTNLMWYDDIVVATEYIGPQG